MGLEDVKNEIIAEAKQEKEVILGEAEEEKNEILEEAEEKAEKIREEAEQEIEDKKESMEKRAVSNANMDAKQKKLEAKQYSIQEVFHDFRENLEDLSEEEKQDFVKNAVEETDFDVGKILGSSEFKDALSDYESEELEDEGIILVSSDEERRVNYTFDKIVEDLREDYRKQVADKLFG